MDELRKQILAKRREFAKADKYADACRKICEHLRDLPEFKEAKHVMFYLPLFGEVDVTGLFAAEKNFYIPITHGIVITPARYFSEMPMRTGEYGVTEPESPVFADKNILDFVVVPAVAADRNGNRMGFGKGCYDRFLDGLSCPRAAAVFELQLAELSPKPHDVPMDYIITEGGCIYGKH